MMSVAMETSGMRCADALHQAAVIARRCSRGACWPAPRRRRPAPGTSMCGMTLGRLATVSSSSSVIQLGCEVRKRMRSSAFDLVHADQQPGQVGVVGLVLAVAVDDLPEQGDFLDALARQGARLGQDIVRRAAALDPAAVGDDAEGAGVRAAVDDRDEARDQAGRARAAGRTRSPSMIGEARGGGALFHARALRPGSGRPPAGRGRRAGRRRPRRGSAS